MECSRGVQAIGLFINSKLWCSMIRVINFVGQAYHDKPAFQMLRT